MKTSKKITILKLKQYSYFLNINIESVNMLSEEEYYENLDDMEKLVFDIAKDHLGTSFHVMKSNGYANGGGIKKEVVNEPVKVDVAVEAEPAMIKKKIRVKKVKPKS